MAITSIFNPLKSQKATQGAILFLIWVAFFLRTMNLDSQSLWRDEVDAIDFAAWPLAEMVANLTRAGHNGPLFYVLLRPWQQLVGASEFAARYPSALAGTLALPLAYLIARRLSLSRRTAILLALLMATSPYLVWYGQEAKMYSLLLMVVLLAFLAYLKALAGNQFRWWLTFVVASTMSFYLHILSPLMLPVYGLIAVILRRQWRRHWRGWLVSMACLTLPYLPLVIWQMSYFLEGTSRGHAFYPLRRQTDLLLRLYSSGLLSFSGLLPVGIAVFLLLTGLLLPDPRGRLPRRHRLILAVWLLVPPLTVYLISLRVPVFEDRYLIYITPGFYLLIALGLALLRHHARWLASLCLSLILVVNLVSVWRQQHQPIKANFRAAAAYLASRPVLPANIMIQMPYLRKTFDYYYPHDYKFLEGLWTNGDKTDLEVHNEMNQLTAGLTDLWLVVSEEEMWDRRNLVRNWLDENADLIDRTHFMRVDVYHYQFRPGAIDSQSW